LMVKTCQWNPRPLLFWISDLGSPLTDLSDIEHANMDEDQNINFWVSWDFQHFLLTRNPEKVAPIQRVRNIWKDRWSRRGREMTIKVIKESYSKGWPLVPSVLFCVFSREVMMTSRIQAVLWTTKSASARISSALPHRSAYLTERPDSLRDFIISSS
jgi:hypothetical protein